MGKQMGRRLAKPPPPQSSLPAAATTGEGPAKEAALWLLDLATQTSTDPKLLTEAASYRWKSKSKKFDKLWSFCAVFSKKKFQ